MRRLGYLQGILAGCFWGLGTVIMALFWNSSNASNNTFLSITLLHDLISSVFLIIFILIQQKETEFKKVSLRTVLVITLISLLGGPLGMGMYQLSVQKIGPTLASSISSLYPAAGALIAFIFFKEKLSRKKNISLSISILAIVGMSLGSHTSTFNLNIGYFFIFITVVSWGSEATLASYAMKENLDSTIVLSLRQFFSSLIYCFFIVLTSSNTLSFNLLGQINVKLLILGAITATVSYLFYYSSIDKIGSVSAMALNISYPAWAFVFHSLFYKSFNVKEALLSVIIVCSALYGVDSQIDNEQHT